jgi:hypothetical protein
MGCNVFFPNEKYIYNDIFPVIEQKFEDFYINCPHNYEKVLFTNYSKNVLSEIVIPNKIHIDMHEDFFNSIEAIPFFKYIFKICKKSPLYIKYNIGPLILLSSFLTFGSYLSNDQKKEYLGYFDKQFKIKDIINGDLLKDTFIFYNKIELDKLINMTLPYISKSIASKNYLLA